MVNACVYAWAFSLLGLQVFGDTSKPTGMPTLLSCVPYQGGSIAKTTKYGHILLSHSVRGYCRRYREAYCKASIIQSDKPNLLPPQNRVLRVQSHGNNYPRFEPKTASVEHLYDIVSNSTTREFPMKNRENRGRHNHI